MKPASLELGLRHKPGFMEIVCHLRWFPVL